VSLLTPVHACRACGQRTLAPVLALGQTPLANSLLPAEGGASALYPLDLVRCATCGLVQIAQIVDPGALFSDYVYFSSNSETMLRHSEEFTRQLVEREHLGPKSLVVEIASNDGYLLQYLKGAGVGVLGIEPAVNIAEYAEREKGIRTLARFFGQDLARELANDGCCADVILGNNVLAHVPDLNDFVAGMKLALKPTGVITMEFPHLMRLIEGNQFEDE